MAKVVSFPRSSGRACERALAGFVDNGDLLEFSEPEVERPQTHNQAQIEPPQSKSIYTSDWTNQELADLYRAYSLVRSAQPGLECDRGISDEGDPWFIIGNNNGDVLIHICRIKGTYILDSTALTTALKGTNFNALIEGFLGTVVGEHVRTAESSQSPANVVQLARGGTVCLHPSMMIAALVWTLLMNSKELSLPASNGLSHNGLEQGEGRDSTQNETQHDTDSDDDGVADMSAMAAFAALKADPVNSERLETDAGDLSLDLSAKERCAGRDEKQLHFSAHSQALTTVAIAAGFYASAEAADVFLKSFMNTPADTPSVAIGGAEVSETNEASTILNPLSDALALLSSVVDLAVVGNQEDYLAGNHNAADENMDDLTLADMNTDIDQQVLTAANEVSENLTEAPQAKEASLGGLAGEIVNDKIAAQDDMVATLSGEGPEINLTEPTSDTSLQSITQVYASSDADVIRYDTASFQSGLGEFDGELQKYSEVIEIASLPTEEENPPTPTAEDPGAPSPKEYNDAAEEFIKNKIINYDLDILVFDNEVIFIDKAAYSGDSTTVSWQLDDGNYVSMIGLSSDMAEFLVA